MMNAKGMPELMVSFTDASQLDMEKTMKGRDERFQVDYKHKADIRKDIPVPEIDPRECFVLHCFCS